MSDASVHFSPFVTKFSEEADSRIVRIWILSVEIGRIWKMKNFRLLCPNSCMFFLYGKY